VVVSMSHLLMSPPLMSHPLPTNRRQTASTELNREQPICGGPFLWDPASGDLRSVPSRSFSHVTVLGCTRARQNGRSPADLPRRPLRVGRRVLAGVAFTDVGGRPAIARGAIRQKGYEPSVLLVRGATGDHLVGQVGGVDGVYQSLRIVCSGLSDERHLVRLEDREL
jgi:hypothetical protein